MNACWKKYSQMYTASVNYADADKRSENDMKMEFYFRNDMKWHEKNHESVAEKYERAVVCTI